MTLKQNEDKTPEEKIRETKRMEEQLGFPLESADPIEDEKEMLPEEAPKQNSPS